MTSLLAWLAVDQRGPTALYFASDSRRSWSDTVHRDDCTKLFACKMSADIFAMVGDDITCPEQNLPLLCQEIDSGSIPPGQATSAHGRSEWAFNYMQRVTPPSSGNFSVLHGSRNGFSRGASFVVNLYRFSSLDGWSQTELSADMAESGHVSMDGTGRLELRRNVGAWEAAAGRVSRAYYSAFIDTLAKEADPRSGGAPQLLVLPNVGGPRHLGVRSRLGAFYRGRLITAAEPPPSVEWRNDEFERVDAAGARLQGSQRQPRPREV
jgi:hypothetical protein